MTNDVAIVGTDDWGSLRPREKQELIQMFSETYSERYRDMLEEYYRSISIAETKEETRRAMRRRESQHELRRNADACGR